MRTKADMVRDYVYMQSGIFTARQVVADTGVCIATVQCILERLHIDGKVKVVKREGQRYIYVRCQPSGKKEADEGKDVTEKLLSRMKKGVWYSSKTLRRETRVRISFQQLCALAEEGRIMHRYGDYSRSNYWMRG